MIYLYLKTHNKTGLKYLGKTSKNPFVYKGSGDYWKKHLKIHGTDVTTEILKECKSNTEVQHWGSYYSELWNIVDALDASGNKIWANLKPETGNGAPEGRYHHNCKKNPGYNIKKHPNYGKKHSELTKQKNRKSNSGKNSKNFGSFWINDGSNNKKITGNMIPLGWVKGRLTNFGKYDKKSTGNPNYNSQIRKFIHKSGLIENCTQSELIKKYSLRASSVSSIITGRIKSTGGWRVS